MLIYSDIYIYKIIKKKQSKLTNFKLVLDCPEITASDRRGSLPQLSQF